MSSGQLAPFFDSFQGNTRTGMVGMVIEHRTVLIRFVDKAAKPRMNTNEHEFETPATGLSCLISVNSCSFVIETSSFGKQPDKHTSDIEHRTFKHSELVFTFFPNH